MAHQHWLFCLYFLDYYFTWFENGDGFEATAFTSVGGKLPVPAHQFLHDANTAMNNK